MNAQQLPFKLYLRLINNRSQIVISLQGLYTAIDQDIPLFTTLQARLPKLGFILNQDYIEVETKYPAQQLLIFFVTPETALIYLNAFETTYKIKHCIKAIAYILSSPLVKGAPSLIEQEVKKHQYITQINTFLKNYFGYEHHFLISEDDFNALERAKGACSTIELLLLAINNNTSLSYEGLSDLFSCCTEPLYNVLNRVKDVNVEVKNINMLANGF